MQRQNLVRSRQALRAPMLDMTNIQPANCSFKIPSVFPAFQPSKISILQPTSVRAYTTMDTFEPAHCLHLQKIRAANGKYANCADCGAFVSNVPVHVSSSRKTYRGSGKRHDAEDWRSVLQCCWTPCWRS